MTAINLNPQERFVRDMARYVKTHRDWKNLQPEAAMRAALWVLVSDRTAFDDLCSVWGDDEFTWTTCAECGGNIFRHTAWSHEGGTPPQDHDATPDENGSESAG